MKKTCFALLSVLLAFTAVAETNSVRVMAPDYASFHPLPAPQPQSVVLKEYDKLAICGDSITEQKMYSRIMETYLTVCTPELQITARQYGWSGEKADGFLRRMTNDVLRFHPTIATTCYGMNDHLYRRYEPSIGATYRSNSLAIVESFKEHDVRVIQGSPGAIGVRPKWAKEDVGTADDMNHNLCELRNIGIQIARLKGAGFADVFWPMLVASKQAKDRYGADYEVPGKDGVHPGWSGHVIMAYAFLKSFGLKGEIGNFVVDLNGKKSGVSAGHELLKQSPGEITVTSHRYPFCATGELKDDNSIRSGMSLIPFNSDLNRLTLTVKGAKKKQAYTVIWGGVSRTYSGAALLSGVNLAEDFAVNPFSEAFAKVDAAVAAKQAFETKQIKQIFHGAEGQKDMAKAVDQTEAERKPLAEAIKTAFIPVTHTLTVLPAGK